MFAIAFIVILLIISTIANWNPYYPKEIFSLHFVANLLVLYNCDINNLPAVKYLPGVVLPALASQKTRHGEEKSRTSASKSGQSKHYRKIC